MQVVKILTDEDGTKIKNPQWCAINDWGDGDRTLCDGQVFGYGEGNATYKTKEGKVTCPNCIGIIKYLSKYLK